MLSLNYEKQGNPPRLCGKKAEQASLSAGLFCFGRLNEKELCLLQVLRYRSFVNKASRNCYKSLKQQALPKILAISGSTKVSTAFAGFSISIPKLFWPPAMAVNMKKKLVLNTLRI